MTCKFIHKDGHQCRRTILFKDGFCIDHSSTEKSKIAREKKLEMNKKKGKRNKLVAKKFKLPSQSPLKQVRKNCLDCCGGHSKTVMFCASLTCELWYLRFGQLPKALVREHGDEYAELFNKENFKENSKYDPDIAIEDMEL